MSRYKVLFQRTLFGCTYIDAENQRDAEDKADELEYSNEPFEIDDYDFIITDVTEEKEGG